MASWTRSLSSALVVALAMAAAPAVAKTKKKVDPAELQARGLFADAQKAYDVGEFDRALQLYSDAYKLKPLPGFLFNIAQCHRQKGTWNDAAFFYGRFIDASNTTAPNIELARELIDEMRRKASEADAAKQAAAEREAADQRRKDDEAARLAAEAAKAKLVPDPLLMPPPPPPPPPEEPVYAKGWFWGVVGAGVAVVGAGIATAVVLSNQTPTPPFRPTTSLEDIR